MKLELNAKNGFSRVMCKEQPLMGKSSVVAANDYWGVKNMIE
jgi:hypothetical protein